MIKVDVNVLTMNEKYEFNLDENTKVESLIEEICAIVSTKLGFKWQKESKDIFLSDKDLKTFLPKDLTLRECGVKDGHELLII